MKGHSRDIVKTTVMPHGYKYEIGQIYSFETEPATRFSIRETGRYGTLKILGFKNNGIYHVVLKGIFDHPPNMDEVKNLPWLQMPSRGPVCRSVDASWRNELKEFSLVGIEPLSERDLHLFATCDSSGPWINSALIAEVTWRREYDNAALEEEINAERAFHEEQLRRQRLHYETRLKALTWDSLLQETLFARWEEHPPFPSAEFTQASRQRIQQDIRKLQALGSKPKRQEVRAILKASVDWFRTQDAKLGGVIETEEREDIYILLKELAHLAGQGRLSNEIENWLVW